MSELDENVVFNYLLFINTYVYIFCIQNKYEYTYYNIFQGILIFHKNFKLDEEMVCIN